MTRLSPSSRRTFFYDTARFASAAWTLLAVSPRLHAAIRDSGQRLADRPDDEIARDEEYWSLVAQAFHLDGRYVILNGGGQNPPTRDSLDALVRYEQFATAQARPNNSALLDRIESHRNRLAQHLNCKSAEVAITRNTTEGLNIVAHGLDLRDGDEVIVSSFDAAYAGEAFQNRVRRGGIKIVQVDLPEPPRDDDVVERFRAAISSRTRLIAVSHIADSYGFVLPIRRLAELAHLHGALMLADGALSFGRIEVNVQELGCDFYASSLHKWLGAPLGTGVLYVREKLIPSLWPLYGVGEPNVPDIRKYEWIGTRSGSTIAAIGQAIDFHETIGPSRKAARLNYLLQYVLPRLDGVPGVTWLSDVEPDRRTISRIGVRGWSGVQLAAALRERFNFWTLGAPGWDNTYISPNLFNLTPQMDRFVDAIKTLSRERPPDLDNREKTP